MEDKILDDLLKETLNSDAKTSPFVNNRLLHQIKNYEKKSVSLWYVPLILSALMFFCVNISSWVFVSDYRVNLFILFVSFNLMASVFVFVVIFNIYFDFKSVTKVNIKGGI